MSQVRVQILLESRQHAVLKKVAKRQEKSVSELVRQITDEYLSRNAPDQDEVLQALDNLKRIREKQAPYTGDPVSEARQERG
jgi:predicted nucleic acid-binding protein